MPTLSEALQKLSLTVPAIQNGQCTQETPMDGAANVSKVSGETSGAIGQAQMQREMVVSGIGSAHGKTELMPKPQGREETLHIVDTQPDKAALAAVTSWLPPSVERWLNLQENGPKNLEGKLMANIPSLTLTPDELKQVNQSLWMLHQTTKPSRESMPELMELIQTMMTAFKWRTFGGEENVTMNLKVWCEAVGDFPIYAVSKAVRWAVMGNKKEPSIAEFVSDVRLACGHNVLERKRLLEKLT